MRGNSEFTLQKDEIVDTKQAVDDSIDEDTLINTRETLTDIHERIEDILYNANLAVGEKISASKLAKINNIVLELEKSTINLGSVVSEEEEQ